MLNGKMIGEQKGGDATKYITTFNVPYEPGELKAIGVVDGIEQVQTSLVTTGKPASIRLFVDRDTIAANRNDLSFVKIEVLDKKGRVVPDAHVRLKMQVEGMAEIAGCGNACPTDMRSFNNPEACFTWHGKALAILRPSKELKSGEAILNVKSDNLPEVNVKVVVK
jgi:beta-galactosidase